MPRIPRIWILDYVCGLLADAELLAVDLLVLTDMFAHSSGVTESGLDLLTSVFTVSSIASSFDLVSSDFKWQPGSRILW